ncbi:transcription factor Tfb4 [Ramicandelaber brevisporus]|nr:transcription factor Tfb4 [Ramicandelaber brevisporus]
MITIDHSEEDPSLLVLVVDLDPVSRRRHSPDKNGSDGLLETLRHILVFINAYLALKHDNDIAIIGYTVHFAQFLYPSPSGNIRAHQQHQQQQNANGADEGDMAVVNDDVDNQPLRTPNVYHNFRVIDEMLLSGALALLEKEQQVARERNDDWRDGVSLLSNALALAMCYINRKLRTADPLVTPRPRILALMVADDSASQYVAIMNNIFLAQKKMIPIDVCKLLGSDSVFMQQAAHLTGGCYLRLQHQLDQNNSGPTTRTLLQTLMFAFLPDAFSRQFVTLPGTANVDFRAACFCHRKIVDIGFVCSVCLSIFCSFVPICGTCRVKFEFPPGMAAGNVASLSRAGSTQSVGSNSNGFKMLSPSRS